MIVLARYTGAVRLDVGPGALCVHHHDYTAPDTGPGSAVMPFEEFWKAPLEAVAGHPVLVVVGLSRIMTPANRVRLGQVLLRPLPGVRRIVVDRTLFVAEPWRLDWPFRCIGRPYQGLASSFLAETRWHQAQDGVREDMFTAEAVAAWGRGLVRSDYVRYFEPLVVERVALPGFVHDEYAALKERCFDEEHTGPAIVARLARFAQEALPERFVPPPARLFGRCDHRVVQTDLGVDDWLVGQLRRLVELTNGIGEAFHVVD